MSFVQGQGDKKVVELGTSFRKDLGTTATPITVSGDAHTAPSVYMCEMFARVALVLYE